MARKVLKAKTTSGRSARVVTTAEMILKNSHPILQIVVCVSLLIVAIYIITTPNHPGTVTDWAFGILGVMVGRILRW